jgi:hypothetical protein
VTLAWLSNPMLVILNALAAFRLTVLWVNDMLPPLPRIRSAIMFWATEREAAQEKAALEADRAEQVGGTPRLRAPRARQELYGNQPIITYLVTCFWCSGYWISLGVFLAACLTPLTVWAFLAVPLALSAVVGLLSRLAD